MNVIAPALLRSARRLVEALQKETALARRGALGDLARAAADKDAALRDFARSWAERGETTQTTASERDELRRILAAADENATILEAVSATLGDLASKVRTAAATALDPGTYSPAGRNTRHVRAARVDASV